jgi:IS30 family transposase
MRPEQAWARRWRGSRLERWAELRAEVLERLARGHSPEQVAGRLRLERGAAVLSAESIYRFIYAQIRHTDDTHWRNYLPRRKYKRGYRQPGRSRSPMRLIAGRVPLAERPPEVLERRTGGHWEADLMLFRGPGEVLLVAQERASRLLLVAGLQAALRQSVTFDNGAEFSHHHRLHTRLQMRTYFCDKHAPWQKGGIENAIGRLRRVLPRKVDPKWLTQDQIDRLTARYNHTQENASDTKHPQNPLHLIWCTSNVNPYLRCTQDDSKNKQRQQRQRQ